MQQSTERILTTHAGSLPRPADVAQLMYDYLDGKPTDPQRMEDRVREAVADVVRRQREIGIDVVGDGEMGKVGFSNYLQQRYEGFGGVSGTPSLADIDDIPVTVYDDEGAPHLRIPRVVGPLRLRDRDGVQQEINDLAAALGDADPDGAFVGVASPGQVAYNCTNDFYPTHEAYIDAVTDAVRPEYQMIVDAGFNLQLDSPDLAMTLHSVFPGSDLVDPRAHVEASVRALNRAISGLPPEKLRLHVCWGNYAGPHHKDVELREIVDLILDAEVGFIYVEGANPRHEHEWEVWREVSLPDDKALIVGVIDTKTNMIEHPRVVAQRIERYADVVGRERVIAAPDCGFATFVGLHSCNPGVAWPKLQSLTEGARIASERLY